MVTASDIEALLALVNALRERLQGLQAELKAEERAGSVPIGSTPRLTRLK